MKKLLVLLMSFMIFLTAFGAGDELENLLNEDDAVVASQLGVKNKSGNLYEGIIQKVVGQALSKNKNQEVWNPVFEGMQVKEGMTILTMDKAQVKVALPSGTVIDIRPKTQAVFETLRQDPVKTELTETGIKLLVGKVYSNVRKLVETGSKYEVKTNSATAGVRGTQFEMSADENGVSGVTVFEGTVMYSTSASPTPVSVEKGEKISSDANGLVGEKQKHNDMPPADVEEEKTISPENTAIVESPKGKDEAKKEKDKAKNEKNDTSSGGSGGGRMAVESGSTVVDEKFYATLEFKPDFYKIFGTPIGVGLKVSFLQGKNIDDEETFWKYGPAASDKWYDSISLRWVEYETKKFGIRYGELSGVLFGQGLLMDGYATFGVKSHFNRDKWGIMGMAPLKETPISERDNLYAGRFEMKTISNLWAGVTYVGDMDEKIDEEKFPNSGIAADVYVPLSKMLIPYFEYATLPNYGYGWGTGIRGNIAVVNYKLEYRNIGDNFIPDIYDAYYENLKDKYTTKLSEMDDLKKAQSLLEEKIIAETDATSKAALQAEYDNINTTITEKQQSIDSDSYNLDNLKAYSGYLARVGVGFGGIFSAAAQYEDYGDVEGKRITGQFSAKVMDRIRAGIDYNQKNIDFDTFDWMKKDTTSINGYLVYPLNPAVDIRVEYIKKPGEDVYQTFKTIIVF